MKIYFFLFLSFNIVIYVNNSTAQGLYECSQWNKNYITNNLENKLNQLYAKSDTNRVIINTNTKVNIFIGLGYTPFKLNTGIGYFVTENTEINILFSSMFMPLSLDINVFSVGMRLYDNSTSTIYSISTGMAMPRKAKPNKLNGFCVEGSLGYLFDSDIGFYFLPSFKIGGVFRKQNNPYGIIGIDLSIGWLIK